MSDHCCKLHEVTQHPLTQRRGEARPTEVERASCHLWKVDSEIIAPRSAVNANEVLATYDELKMQTGGHLLRIATAVTTPNGAVNLTDISALLALVDFATNELAPALKRSAKYVETAEASRQAEADYAAALNKAERDIARLQSMLAHPAGKGRA